MSAIAVGLSTTPASQAGRGGVSRVAVGAAAAAGISVTAATAWAGATSPLLVDPTNTAVWRSLVVASYVVAGTYTLWRRPGSCLGAIIIAAGFLYAATSLAGLRAPLLYAFGETFLAVAVVYTAWMYLVYPGGRLKSRIERGFILAGALSVAALWGLMLLLSPAISLREPLLGCAANCPRNALQLISVRAATVQALSNALDIVLAALLIGTSILVCHRARSQPNPHRRAITPLAMVFVASLIAWALTLLMVHPNARMIDAVRIADGVLLVAVPVAILAHQIRGDILAAKGLARIAVHAAANPLTPPAIQRIIGDALRDPTVSLAVWNSAHRSYTDMYGEPLDFPDDSGARGLTSITHDDRPLAALVHDPMLDTDSDILRGLGATALMLLEKTRLVDELRASRTRIVATAERERQRLERDLHDGAQNRLMAIQVKLRLAQRTPHEDLDELLETISNDAAEAVEELRALARGIYPSVLRDRGVGDALYSFAMRAPIPVSVEDEGVGRCAPGVEAAIYFCSLEAVQNAIKHAGSHVRVKVTLRRDERCIRFVVADDGAGMDTSTASDGVGLISMRDRLGAVGGELDVSSSPGRGTTVRGTIPVNSCDPTIWRST